MGTDKLRAVLGEDGFAELQALLLPAPTAGWQVWLKGTVKSWTVWFGVLLLGFPELLPALAPQLEQLLDASAYKRLMSWAGVIVILLRFKTNQSVKDKAVPTT